MTLMLLGERYNLTGARWEHWEQTLRDDPRKWLDFSLRCSCYRRGCGKDRRLLENVGLRGRLEATRCMNLLPPGEVGEWDASEAGFVATMWRDWVFDRYINGPVATHVMMLGKRVTRAVCGYDAELLSVHTMSNDEGFEVRLLSFPHPSGLNRWWNDPEHWDDARCAVEELLCLDQSSVACAT